MPLQLSASHLRQIHQHLEQVYPQEGCGLLMGNIHQDCRITTEVWPAENTWTATAPTEVTSEVTSDSNHYRHSRRDRYWIDPQFLLSAQRYCCDRNLKLIGIYHSHPDHPAIPSDCDRRLAWPNYSYLIVSVQKGLAKESLSWCLDPQHQFAAEALKLIS